MKAAVGFFAAGLAGFVWLGAALSSFFPHGGRVRVPGERTH